jgi:hypothetical protein
MSSTRDLRPYALQEEEDQKIGFKVLERATYFDLSKFYPLLFFSKSLSIFWMGIDWYEIVFAEFPKNF